MSTLIAYASKHGSTAEIAERIAATIRGAGHDAQALRAPAVRDVAEFEAVLVGSAVYMGHWMKDATDFVNRQRSQLEARPLWLFSSGPVGPRTLPEAAEIAIFRKQFEVKDHRTFDGALDKRELSLSERMMIRAVKAPYGDYRKWEDIEAWAKAIATWLALASRAPEPVTAGGAPWRYRSGP